MSGNVFYAIYGLYGKSQWSTLQKDAPLTFFCKNLGEKY